MLMLPKMPPGLDWEACNRARLARGIRPLTACFSPVCGRPEFIAARFARYGLHNQRMFSSMRRPLPPSFRPCLRCRPETAPGSPAWNGTATTVARGMRLIQEGFLDKAAVTDLADQLGIGPRHLLRLFLQHAGATPSEVAATRRVQAAKRLIDETAMSFSEIAFAAGFRSIRRFNDTFRAIYGRPPSSFRRMQI